MPSNFDHKVLLTYLVSAAITPLSFTLFHQLPLDQLLSHKANFAESSLFTSKLNGSIYVCQIPIWVKREHVGSVTSTSKLQRRYFHVGVTATLQRADRDRLIARDHARKRRRHFTLGQRDANWLGRVKTYLKVLIGSPPPSLSSSLVLSRSSRSSLGSCCVARRRQAEGNRAF